MVSALMDAGLPATTVERAADEGWLDFHHIDDFLPHAPGPRSERSFAEFQATVGPRSSFLPAVYEVLGLPKPNPSAPIYVDEEEMFERFLEGWRLARDGTYAWPSGNGRRSVISSVGAVSSFRV